MATAASTDTKVKAESVRYHSLDALRAWAMSMGIVLHAAWIMTPGEAGAPMTDASASEFTGYIDAAIHTFRMQLFFVLAGFFACLLVRKRGVFGFLRNRGMRIALPIIVFWFLLWPPMMTQFQAAQIKSGAMLTEQSAWQMTVSYFNEMTPATTMTMHMWFIYYLLWIYVIVLLIRWGLNSLDANRRWRDTVSDGFGFLMNKSWLPLVLAGICAPLMYPMQDMSGIQMDAMSLYPVWAGLFSYLIYFTLGWLVLRNVDKLAAMLRWWPWQLTAGVALTVCYYFFLHWSSQNGYVTPLYPGLTVNDVRYDYDKGQRCYPELREQMLDAPADSIPALVLEYLPPKRQQFVRENEIATENQLTGLMTDISLRVIESHDFYSRVGQPSSSSLTSAVQLPEQTRASTFQEVNRSVLEAGFSGLILGEDSKRPFYRPIRSAYCYLYSLTTWLMILGCIGFSQHFFRDESPFWRYFSDSSYWMYLMHLVIQFQLLLWVGELQWHWTVKFAFYVGVTLVLLTASYHFLVRPTWIGWLLNGRMYRTSLPREVPVRTEPEVSIPAPHFPLREKIGPEVYEEPKVDSQT